MPSFEIKGDKFYLNGEPYTILSGAMHYFRIPREYWRDRMVKMIECGFNTLETYTCWNLHEPKEGEFNFSGMLDLESYIDLAAELGLNVILRPGPYICSEWDFGALPAWLLSYKDMNIRCNDDLYISKVERYLKELLRRVVPKLFTNGGNIIMMQVENEYGSYGDDHDYMQRIADIYVENGVDCQLFTSDGSGYSNLSGGSMPQYPCVVNFGSKATENFKSLEKFRPGQPKMCGEFWCGWFDHWFGKHNTRDPQDVAKSFKEVLDNDASINVYMFHGGTNFGFMSGANCYEVYEPTVTSYDDAALLTEAGDLTPAYYAVRNVIENFKGEKLPVIQSKNSEKASYGKIHLSQSVSLFEALPQISKPIRASSPKYMEDLGQNHGYILYSTTIHGPLESKKLCFDVLHDRAIIYLNGEYKGYMERSRHHDEIEIAPACGESVKLDILCENMGRVNYGPNMTDRKGLQGIRLGLSYHFGWDMYSLPMDNLENLVFQSNSCGTNVASFFKGELIIPDEPKDTFIRLDGFHKGIVVVNGFNLGRYYNDVGPQKTLYCPAPMLRCGSNEIIVFESDSVTEPVIEFCDTPDLG